MPNKLNNVSSSRFDLDDVKGAFDYVNALMGTYEAWWNAGHSKQELKEYRLSIRSLKKLAKIESYVKIHKGTGRNIKIIQDHIDGYEKSMKEYSDINTALACMRDFIEKAK